MPDPATLRDLLERVEGARWGDIDLDQEIECALVPGRSRRLAPKALTFSIDAAMALIEYSLPAIAWIRMDEWKSPISQRTASILHDAPNTPQSGRSGVQVPQPAPLFPAIVETSGSSFNFETLFVLSLPSPIPAAIGGRA